MQRRTKPLALALALTLAPACGSDAAGPDNEIAAELVGTWTASPACAPACGFTFISVNDPADSVNFTALGATTRLTLASSGSFTFNSGLPTAPVLEGTMRQEGNVLVVEPTDEFPEEERIDYALDGTTLQLDWRETITYALEPGEPAETVRIRAVLKKN